MGFLSGLLGGGSKSSSSSSSTQNQYDLRVAGGEASKNFSSGPNAAVNYTESGAVTITGSLGSGAKIEILDAGAVAQAFGYAKEVTEGTVNKALGTARDAIDEVAAAYDTARDGEQRILIYVGIAVAGIVAVIALQRGK